MITERECVDTMVVAPDLTDSIFATMKIADAGAACDCDCDCDAGDIDNY